MLVEIQMRNLAPPPPAFLIFKGEGQLPIRYYWANLRGDNFFYHTIGYLSIKIFILIIVHIPQSLGLSHILLLLTEFGDHCDL